MTWILSDSVGRWERGAVNHKRDVVTVQTLLTAAAKKRNNPKLHPKGIDGAIARPPGTSNTVQAIEAFQTLFGGAPDGLIEPNGTTFDALLDTVWGATSPSQVFHFPFRQLPTSDWMTPPRRFGANRHGNAGPRAHAGCDLYFSEGTPMYAITDGIVVRDPYNFYAQTDALEIDHGPFLARYGEIQRGCPLRAGNVVQAGQRIANVGHLVGINVPSDMLHLELYDKSETGSLTTNRQNSGRHTNQRFFLRRRDLIDPTPFLDTWQSNPAP